MKKILMAIAVAAVSCGCVSVSQNDGGTANLRPFVVKDVIHEKYEVGQEKITATDRVKCLFGLFSWGSSAKHTADHASHGFFVSSRAKNGAYANACDAGECDAIVAARYKVTVKNYFIYSCATAEVSGYPVKVTGVEVIENTNPSTGQQHVDKDTTFSDILHSIPGF